MSTDRGIGIVSMKERPYPIGSRLEVNSAAGKGTRIVIYLPGKEAE